ncbi:acetoin utilization transport system ATP-binding protein [Streptohalobacillus salinus]|uniref:Acetoin utilization transport system ATP-binding protein n=1 Tax=Streptohalobacillus salinus TaxID=621096 RepID=A0A2V3W505_9BACI|nr:ABC transporter ATP-binding protein [Streptohalobacillus salinus]PXW89182.1 acetoin utilization transport system ATP-binding protein [Streptohalobacillus salinus]
MIEVKDLSHQFELGKKGKKTTIPVLKTVSFMINKGEIVTLVGRSGSGKSTLLHLISGFLPRQTGTIILNGQDVTGLTETAFSQFRLGTIGFIFQNFQLIQSMTAYQNVELPLILNGVSETARHVQTLNTLAKVGLEGFEHHYPSELSGGQQQRVSVARALVLNPLIILADEPTGSLDSETERDLLDLILELNATLHITFLIITHDEEVAAIGHRSLAMHDGQLIDGEVN